MNKIYLLTAAFAVMASLSGCSDTELASIDTAQEKTPIGFHTVGSQMGSRATSINSSNDLKSFNVYAFLNDNGTDGALFMGTEDKGVETGGVNISYNGGKWNYTTSAELMYWPTDALNFYAVSPVLDPNFLTWQITPNTKKIHYVSGDEYGDGTFTYIDVMYAIATDQRKADNGGIVKLQFKHVTSQVVFKAKKQRADMNIEIKSIKLHNLETGGFFTIPKNRTDLQQTDWTPQSATYKCGLTVINKGDNDPKINVGTEATDISSSQPMFLIPQQLTAWDTSNNTDYADTHKQSYLSIECKIKIGNTDYVGSGSGYGTLFVPFGPDWQPGKRYVYTLVFGGGYDAAGNAILQPINFDAKVEEWSNDENSFKSDKNL